MIGNLLLNRNFNPGYHKVSSGRPSGSILLAVRIFSKQDSVDDCAALSVAAAGNLTAELLRSTVTKEIENYKIISLISGKKVFLQVRPPLFSGNLFNKYLAVPYNYGSPGVFAGSLSLFESNIKNIFKILGHSISDLDDFIDEGHIRALEKILYRKLSGPPPNFSDSILSVSDRDLQLLLNHILHKNIASADMLASYIYGLGDDGLRITDNLSKSVRAQVIEKVKLARLKSTYRWSEEVKYIIHRNLYAAARELDIIIKGMEALDFISRSYERNAAKHMLQARSVAEWLAAFDRDSNFQAILSEIRRKVLVEALSFAEWNDAAGFFEKYVSKDGVELIRQDVEFSRSLTEEKRFLSLAQFYRKVKDLTYAPLVGKMDFNKEVMRKISGGDSVDLIVDEIGFAKVVFALKNMARDWVYSILSGPLLNIYEDVLGGKIKIKKFEDYRIAESRRDFLKALLILCDEEKI